MSTDIKISELNEINNNKTINQIIVNDRSNSSDPGITRKISISNLLPTYSASDSSRRAIVGNDQLISTSQSPGSEAVNTNVIRDNAITETKLADGAVSNNKIQNNTITYGKLTSQAKTDIVNDVIQALYPVGSIYITTINQNPNTLLGIGGWVRFGEGRAIVGFSTTDSDFSPVEKTGGAKTHQLSIAELPAHTHQIDPPSTTTSTDGVHTHTSTNRGGGSDTTTNSIYTQAAANPRVPASTITNPDTGESGAHTHTVDIPVFNSGSTGSSQGHNNLQPYITTFIWKRTS